LVKIHSYQTEISQLGYSVFDHVTIFFYISTAPMKYYEVSQ